MKRMITLLLALAICFGLMPVAAFAQAMPFTDVPDDAFYYNAVAWAVEEEITTGMTPATFGPDENCTRGHVVTFLWRLAGRPEPQGDAMPFVDVEPNEYYTDAILWAVEQDITEGMDATHFDPQGECTRAQIVVFLWRFFGKESAEGLSNPFSDVVSGEWYTSAIIWAAARAITNGMPDQTFAYADTCTRGQVVTFLYRAAKLMEELEEPDEPGLKLVDDASTVNRGDMLRASTYTLTSVNDGISTQAATTKTLKYFDVTLFDYDTATINNATHAADLAENPSLTQWNGLYFNNGSPVAESYAYTTEAQTYTDLTWQQVKNGTYYADEACTVKATVNAVTSGSGEYKQVTVTRGDLISEHTNTWTRCDGYYYRYNGNYYPIYARRSTAGYDAYNYYYYYWGYSTTDSASNVTNIVNYTDQNSSYNNTPFSVYQMEGTVTGYTLTAGGQTLATLDGTDLDQKVGVTLYSKAGQQTTAALSYANYNRWDKGSTSPDGQKFYTGLAANKLDTKGNIVFNVPEGGIFNSDATVKQIYTNVEMPFVYEDGFYSFYSSENGVYFKEDAAQNSTSATATEKRRLYFDEGNPQNNNTDYADGSKNVWLPFDESNTISDAKNSNYHFGMIASIPFTMTTNGRISESDPDSTPIEFSFSGDDDVWVFIDGELVIDLGGIHNRLDAKIDFAENQVTYSVSNKLAGTQATGSFNDEDFELEQTLFGNLISQDRTTFAATDMHTLTVFYLERGEGSSNCRIRFNLPMKDNLTVSKIANQYWSVEDQEATNLSPEHQAAVNNIQFGFTLYKSTDGGENYTKVTNTPFLLMENGAVVANGGTDSNGHFTLKNGQSAKFIGEFTGQIYYVVEDSVENMGFYTPDYSYSGTSANGFKWREKAADNWTTVENADEIGTQELALNATENKSYEVQVLGNQESNDSLNIVCRNYLKHEMPDISVIANDVTLVVDYGLPVNIPATYNDIVSTGNTKKLVGFSGPGMKIGGTQDEDGLYITEPTVDDSKAAELKFGTAKLNDDGSITYTLNKQMTDVEVIDYLVCASDEVTTGSTTTTKYAAAIAHIYIIPATTMYYEENFSDMVTFTATDSESPWAAEGTSAGYVQETGIVGTPTDSPYGSDVAYLNNSGDSNGTSRFVNVENQTAGFRYTFTGTGTSFFARTSKDSGYIYVKIEAMGEDNKWHTEREYMRDTRYLDDENPNRILYNIPVYTCEGLDYNTYRLTCYVYHSNNGTRGTEFYLDGIRVVNPMDMASANAGIATSAYTTDGEAYMTSVTLREKLLQNETDYGEDDELIWKDDFVVFTDSNGSIVLASEYQSNGPKEEVYLNDGQRISFTLVNWDANTNKLYMGMKAPSGNATVKVGTNNTIELQNSVDCYYEITKLCSIDRVGDQYTATFTLESVEGLVSLTNIKVTGTPEFAIITNSSDDDVIGGENGIEP